MVMTKKKWALVAVAAAVLLYFLTRKSAASVAAHVSDPSNDPKLSKLFDTLNPGIVS